MKRKPGRPPKKEEDKRKYQRVAILEGTYERALYNAALRDMSLIEYFDATIKEEKGYDSSHGSM